ncbi:uncharacterized protein LOC128241124 [Mya arenaria]|uniref:uncharacterized protein LOC128241124 n=1 Tax=Mya arenaria TaxID=6604 RepID=UPI0022E7CD2D|nr:uncharacterized protein LOC128241124 [Mya arenaria]
MDKRLVRLDVIEKQLSDVSSKLSGMDRRVVSLKTASHDVNTRLIELEATRAFESSVNDDIAKKQSAIDNTLKAERDKIARLEKNLAKVNSVQEDIIDLKSRSMRNNLLFFGFPEKSSPDDRKNEDCSKKNLTCFRDVLKIENPQDSIKFERVHRIGRYEPSKKRPIVAMFNHFPDKLLIKQKSGNMPSNRRLITMDPRTQTESGVLSSFRQSSRSAGSSLFPL